MKTPAICILVIALAVISVASAQSPKPQPPVVSQIMKDLDDSVAIKFKVADIAVAAHVSALAKPETASSTDVMAMRNPAMKVEADGILAQLFSTEPVL